MRPAQVEPSPPGEKNLSDIILYGSPFSNFVRSARLAFEEKGVDYDLEPAKIKEPEYLLLHPFARMPALRHGDFRLGESIAIMRYVDEAFEGPSLQPSDVRERARMMQWISAFNDYFVAIVGRRILAEIFAILVLGRPRNQATIDAALPEARQLLKILDGFLAKQVFLTGDKLSLADLMYVPHLFYLAGTPETANLLEAVPNLHRWHEDMSSRPSVQATEPPMHELNAA
jgi:glutathione S-transferase